MATAASLYASSPCACYGLSEAEMLTLGSLVQLLLLRDPAADVSVNGLLAEGACYFCSSNASLFETLQITLLNLIVEAG